MFGLNYDDVRAEKRRLWIMFLGYVRQVRAVYGVEFWRTTRKMRREIERAYKSGSLGGVELYALAALGRLVRDGQLVVVKTNRPIREESSGSTHTGKTDNPTPQG